MSRIWYNLTLPIRNWCLRRRYLAEWVSEGRDPKLFPRAGRLTPEQHEWAMKIVREAPR